MELPKRKKIRLPEFDYSTAYAYFITICTANRKNLFWANAATNISCPQDIQLSPYGSVVEKVIADIPRHYPAVSIERHVIMPNHIHLLLQIHSDSHGRAMRAPTISSVVQQMKGKVSKQIGFSPWQKGFYDHIVRNVTDYQDIWHYIEGNPMRWADDRLYMK